VSSESPWDGPALDDSAAQALSVVTLFTTGEPDDARLARQLVDEIVFRPGGAERMIHGLVSLCSGLLVLMEFDGGVPAPDSLRRLGRLVAQASL